MTPSSPLYDDAFTPLEPLDQVPPQSAMAVDVEVMVAQLRHPDPRLRMQAARIFCDVEEPRATELLLDLLADPCPLVRVSAAYGLGRNATPAVVEPAIAALQRDWNGYVRKGLVWALGNAKDPRALDALVAALVGDITAVRLWAASALGQLHPLSAEQFQQAALALAQGLQGDPVAVVRSNCAWSMGQLFDRQPFVAGPALLRALKQAATQDPDVGVQDDARQTLAKFVAHEDELEDED